jgi:hypothetical protein
MTWNSNFSIKRRLNRAFQQAGRLHAQCMPSQLHESLLLLFRNRPELAPELLRDALCTALPAYTEARIDFAEFNVVQPTEYRADLVVLLLDDIPVLGIIVEVQLSTDPRKQYVWPAYVANLRARLECAVCLLVVAAEDSVARWAATPLDMGMGNSFVPIVLGPSGVPLIIDEAAARADPELAVLSAIAHGNDTDYLRSAQIAQLAQVVSLGLDEERSRLYFDLILSSLSEAARQALQTMDPAKYEYQSDFAKKYVAQGRAEGRVEGEIHGRESGERCGRAALITRLLGVRFGQLTPEQCARINSASSAELDEMGERLLSAKTLQEALGPG